jgi:small subunit ribosomal protein S17
MVISMKKRRTYLAEVVRNKMKQTVIVIVKKTFVDRTYKKVIRGLIKLKVHDHQSSCQIGDRVLIQETKPMSKEKHWRVVEIVERSPRSIAVSEEPLKNSVQ